MHSLYVCVKIVIFKEQTKCRTCRYGGEDEYFLEIRESGERGQERTKSEIHKELGKDRAQCLLTVFVRVPRLALVPLLS